jgi:ATP-dependent RNA helicase DeaD
VKPAPAWVGQAKAPKPVATPAEETTENADEGQREGEEQRPRKNKYDRPARTGREPGMTTLFLNVGRKQLVTPADIVGKIAGVTRLPAEAVGAIDIHQRHTLVDVSEADSELILKKLAGIKVKGVALTPARAGDSV